MSGPWWTREGRAEPPPGPIPTLVSTRRGVVTEALLARRPGFTWDWRSTQVDDAGMALLRLVGEQSELVRARLKHLPEKALVEFLRLAGIQPRTGSSAEVVLAFGYSKAARWSLLVPRGFQVGGPAPEGEGELIFETARDLYVAPAEIKAGFLRDGDGLQALALDKTWQPFPAERRPGRALLLGLAVEDPDVWLGPTLSIEIRLVPEKGVPPPVSAGGGVVASGRTPVLLRWEVVDTEGTEPLAVVRDTTQSLSRSGIVEVRLPRTWQAGHPDLPLPLRWLQVRVLEGRFDRPPVIQEIRLNTVEAVGRRSHVQEPLEPVGARTWRTRHAPVIPQTMEITVEEGIGLPHEPWRAVEDLRLYGPEDRVYELDAETGDVRFGDGLHGVEVAPGYRHVVAVRYSTAAFAGRIGEETVTTLLRSAPLVTSVSNPRPATGGAAPETREATLRRGPEEIRARGRAVTAADYALLALRAPANVARVHAMPGVHPRFPGRPQAGVVGVLVVPPDPMTGRPPLPDEDTLGAVARFLVAEVAPAGVEVVAAAPRYHTVRVEALVQVHPNADVGATIGGMLDDLDHFLHPIHGGTDGRGWPFGGLIRHVHLVQRLEALPGVSGISGLSLVLDGRRLGECADAFLPPHDLLWPEAHELIPEVAP